MLHSDGVCGCATVANASAAEALPIEQALDEMDLEILLGPRVDFGDLDLRKRYNEAKKMEILVPMLVPMHLIENLD